MRAENCEGCLERDEIDGERLFAGDLFQGPAEDEITLESEEYAFAVGGIPQSGAFALDTEESCEKAAEMGSHRDNTIRNVGSGKPFAPALPVFLELPEYRRVVCLYPGKELRCEAGK
jgi:hypothetical protein